MKLQLQLQWIGRRHPIPAASDPCQSRTSLDNRIRDAGEVVVVVQVESVLAAHEVDRILDGEVFDHSSLT